MSRAVTSSNRYQTALVQWLDDPSLNVFATITLKQALPIVRGRDCWRPITLADVRHTAWLLRDRVSYKAHGRYRAKYQPFLTFHHGGDGTTRHHLHIVAFRPPNESMDDYEMIFAQIGGGLDWVYERQDFRPIEPGTARAVINYSLGGLNAVGDRFLPEASFVPAN